MKRKKKKIKLNVHVLVHRSCIYYVEVERERESAFVIQHNCLRLLLAVWIEIDQYTQRNKFEMNGRERGVGLKSGKIYRKNTARTDYRSIKCIEDCI